MLVGSRVMIIYKSPYMVPAFLHPSVLPLFMLGDKADQRVEHSKQSGLENTPHDSSQGSSLKGGMTNDNQK